MSSELSDNQKRFICRVLFLLFCALPTCTTLYFATHQRTADQWAQILQAELGVETSIGVVESPRPGEYVFRDVRLFNNDGKAIFESLGAHVTLGDTYRIHFPAPIQVTRSGLSYFLEEACERLVKPDAASKLWEVDFDDIEIVSKNFEFPGFDIGLEVDCHDESDGRVITLSSPLLGENGESLGKKCRLTVARNSLGSYKVSLDTEHAKVPCWLARSWFPEIEKKLGSAAHFAGKATIDYSQSKTSCDLTGVFTGVQLKNIVGVDRYMTAKVNSLEVNGIRLKDNKWTSGRAGIELDDNRFLEMSRSYLESSLMPHQTDGFNQAVRSAFREVREDFRATLSR